MVKTLKVSALAQDDLLEIWENVSENNPAAAVRLMQAFREKFDQILAFPEIGRQRDDLLLHARSIVVKRYVIFYQITEYGIEIWRIWHGARDIKTLFDL
jgi:toxin ParE1/3/4